MKEIPAVIDAILSPRKLQAFLRRNDLQARHGLGQNFLINRNILEKIAASADLSPKERVVEVGPGLGFLSAFLLQQGVSLQAFEKDRALVPYLEDAFGSDPDFHLNIGDVLKSDMDTVLGEEPFKVVANLPYNITSPVFGLLLPRKGLSKMVVTVQRQVAERIVSPPDCKTYGAFTLFCQYYAKTELLFHVAPGNFHPAPSVYSSVVRLTRHDTRLSGRAEEIFFALVRSVFNSRRKTLRNNLKNQPLPEITLEAALDALAECGVSESERGEKLPLEKFCEIAEKIAEQG